ncbi:O-methyltransferase-domain-containing protein [Diplogelasinospora grovesii]|uniref:O-methyltransferase-domain-containing protein n=1 Tax=Diplogelasinospora grovesii TaxID=303347 RepID=A0AAN6N3Y2_9PEZI|nr:O-methyltransferase-domain-containing protein [Diplogelasinospora grovesii]
MANERSDIADKLESLAQQLTETGKCIREGRITLESSLADRVKLLSAVKEVADSVKQPSDEIMEMLPMFANVVAIRLFIKWKAFENIPTNGAISYKDLAEKVGAEANLIIMYYTDTDHKPASHQVAHTRRSQLYTTLNPMSAVMQVASARFDDHLPSFAAMPEYFDKFGLKEPTSRHETIYAYSMDQLGSTVWEIMNKHEDRMRNFMLAMDATDQNYPHLGSYDLSWVVSKASESEGRMLLVDVGGGKGQAIRGVLKATPGLPSHRCVLEDLPEVVEAAKKMADPALSDIKFMGMDFHGKQPVRGALVYYLRRCLHDYGDDECVGILQSISDAMVADSRLLILEQVMSNPPSVTAAATDIFMAGIGGKERTLDGFRDIAGRAGLKILGLHGNPGTDAAVVECAKA